MKNFDIENLERKMPYQISENFFDEVQKNVLQKTILQKKEAKFFSINFTWAISIAASLTLILGLNFFFNKDENLISQNNTIAQNTIEKTTTNSAKNSTENDNLIIQEHEKQIINEINATENLTSSSNQNPKEKTVIVAKNEMPNITEINIDEVLSSLSDKELATLKQNNEQDIYLDLYN